MVENNITTPMRSSGIRNIVILAIAAAVVTFIVFIPSLHNGFINWDDDIYITNNPKIRDMDSRFFEQAFKEFYFKNYHPLSTISHAMDYRLWGMDPKGFHLTSLIIHALNTMLVVFLVRMLLVAYNRGATRDSLSVSMAAFACGIIFGLHPQHVESVVWASERKDVLYAMFFLLALMAYLQYTGERNKWTYYVAALIMFSLSLMSKPMAITLPAVLVIIDFVLGRVGMDRSAVRVVIVEKLPFIILSAVFTVILLKTQQSVIYNLEEISTVERFLNAARGFVFYLEKFSWPAGLTMIYNLNLPIKPVPRDIFVLSVIGVILFLSIFRWKFRLPWAAAWSYYLIKLVPVLGFVQVGLQAAADRYTYLAMLGPTILAVSAVARGIQAAPVSSGKARGLVVATAATALSLVLGMGYMTYIQAGYWKNSLTIWTRQLEVGGPQYLTYFMIANYHYDNNDHPVAIKFLTKAIELNPNNMDAYYYRGISYLATGQQWHALDDFHTVVTRTPENTRAQQYKAMLLETLGVD